MVQAVEAERGAGQQYSLEAFTTRSGEKQLAIQPEMETSHNAAT